jgi:hypothetical protein
MLDAVHGIARCQADRQQRERRELGQTSAFSKTAFAVQIKDHNNPH